MASVIRYSRSEGLDSSDQQSYRQIFFTCLGMHILLSSIYDIHRMSKSVSLCHSL